MLAAILEIFNMIGKGLIPPATAPDQQQYWFLVRVAVVACTAFFGLLFSQVMAYGLLPWFDGFAKQSEVQYIRVHQLDEELLSLRIAQCTAVAGGKTKEEYLRRILLLEDEYYSIEHVQYREPLCSDL